jgi:hypothetical protein
MEICHIKHAELNPKYHKYKGRIVMRGDAMRDEDGVMAVFSEQGASASKVEAARMLDAVARMAGCTGYNIDAIKAFNQIKLPPTEPPLWCMLPRHRWPKEWEGKYERPVVLQEYNLYGHPRAGHYWEQHVHKCSLIEGFKPVPGWECLYIQPQDRVLMSVYVDDFKLAGDATRIDACLNRLRKHMKLDDAIPINEGIYLGLTQRDIPCPPDLLKQKQDLFDLIMNAKHPTALPPKEVAEGVLHSLVRS